MGGFSWLPPVATLKKVSGAPVSPTMVILFLFIDMVTLHGFSLFLFSSTLNTMYLFGCSLDSVSGDATWCVRFQHPNLYNCYSFQLVTVDSWDKVVTYHSSALSFALCECTGPFSLKLEHLQLIPTSRLFAGLFLTRRSVYHIFHHLVDFACPNLRHI